MNILKSFLLSSKLHLDETLYIPQHQLRRGTELIKGVNVFQRNNDSTHPFKGIEQSPETPTKCINSMRQGIILAPTNEAKKEAKLLKLGIKIQIITTHHNKLLNQFYYYKQRINGFHFLWF